jgi:uncharacterized protein (DUF433 family)
LIREEHDVQRLAETNFQVGDGGLQFLTKNGELIAPHHGNQKVFVVHMAEVFKQLGYSDDLTTIRPHDRISIDPKVRRGSQVIQGARISAHLVAQLATEEPVESVLDPYPGMASSVENTCTSAVRSPVRAGSSTAWRSLNPNGPTSRRSQPAGAP